MAHSVGFKPISRKDACVLILGTLPGAESLRRRQYYANKQNSFWKIMGELIGAVPTLPYETRLKFLVKNRISLWDVCNAAEREGSLDSSIQSPVPNDFISFFKTHKNIKLICFNGQPAEKLFHRYVLPDLPEKPRLLPRIILPSTSPAHAGMRLEQKLELWRRGVGSGKGA